MDKNSYNFVEDYKNNSIVADCVNKAILKHHTIYQGDKSIGKTVMVETVCWLLNKPIQRAQANERMTSEHLFGSKTTAASEIMKFSEAESIRLSLLSLRADKGDVLTDENYADIAKWKAAIAHSQAPIKNILIEAVKDETKDVLTDAYFTAANKFYIAVSTEYNNGAVSDASMNIRGIIRALDEVASVNVGGTIFKPMTTLKQALKTCVIDVDEENADNQNLLRILDSISL